MSNSSVNNSANFPNSANNSVNSSNVTLIITNLPLHIDISTLHDLISPYGRILNSQIDNIKNNEIIILLILFALNAAATLLDFSSIWSEMIHYLLGIKLLPINFDNPLSEDVMNRRRK